jgi:hypothetical protein
MSSRALSLVLSGAALAALTTTAALSSSCEGLGGPSETPPPPPAPGWVFSRPFPDIRSLNDVAVFAFDEERVTGAYAVGTAGSIQRYHGR